MFFISCVNYFIMDFRYFYYKLIFGSENSVDYKISKNKSEFDSLKLKSDNELTLLSNINESVNKLERLKNKIKLNEEYQGCIRRYYDYDVY